jgi:hypothetical protein
MKDRSGFMRIEKLIAIVSDLVFYIENQQFNIFTYDNVKFEVVNKKKFRKKAAQIAREVPKVIKDA